MKALINKFYDIREGEWWLALTFFAVSFLLMVVVYFLKPVRDSLFLVGLGANNLPYVFILIAVVAIPVTGLISKSVQRYKSYRVFLWTNAVVILQLLLIRQLLFLEENWVYVLFYLWVGIFTILIVSQFWVFANEAFHASKAKRIFPLINLGAILGAIAGSNATSAFISILSIETEDLVYISIASMVIITAITYGIRKQLNLSTQFQPSSVKRKPKGSGYLKSLFSSRYQLIIAGIIGSAMLVSTLADYQLKAVASIAYPDKAALTSFMGAFYGNVSLAALLIQLLLSGRILRKIGLGGALTIRPAGLLLGAILLAFEPILAFAVFLGGIDNASQYSIDKTGREILFLPFPQKIKERIKFFMDVIVDRFFKGFAGFLLLLLVVVLEFNIRQIAIVTVAFSFLWLLLSRMAQNQYVQQFRAVLGSQYVEIANNNLIDFNEPHTISIINDQLSSKENSNVLRALHLLEGSSATPFANALQALLNHELYEIRLLALRRISTASNKNFSGDILKLLKENDTEIRLESINYICRFAEGDPDQVLLDYLNSNSMLDKSSALGCITKYGNETKRSWIKDELLDEIVANKKKENNLARAQTAQVLGYLNGPQAIKYLPQLLNDPSPAVQKETIKSMGDVKAPEFMPLLINILFSKILMPEARSALAAFGETHVTSLSAYLCDNTINDDHFEAIAKTLALMPYQATIKEILNAIQRQQNIKRKHILVKALSKIRNHSKRLNFSKKHIMPLLDEVVKQSYLFLHADSFIPDEKRFKLLKKLVRERNDQLIEQQFRLLGLVFNPNDLYGAYQGYRSANEQNRAAALELLDNLLSGKQRLLILNLLDPVSGAKTLAIGKQNFKFNIDSYSLAMHLFIHADDNWLKAAALLGITPTCPLPLQHALNQSAEDKDMVVSQAARLVLHSNYN